MIWTCLRAGNYFPTRRQIQHTRCATTQNSTGTWVPAHFRRLQTWKFFLYFLLYSSLHLELMHISRQVTRLGLFWDSYFYFSNFWTSNFSICHSRFCYVVPFGLALLTSQTQWFGHRKKEILSLLQDKLFFPFKKKKKEQLSLQISK